MNAWKAERAGNGNWLGFVDLKLSQEDVKELLDGKITIPPLLDGIGGFLEQGYKISFAYHNVSGSVVATLTGGVGSKYNVGHSLSGWGENQVEAYRSLWYKHNVIAQQEGWADVVEETNISRLR